jgi:UDP-glucose 6-dehydrogenase
MKITAIGSGSAGLMPGAWLADSGDAAADEFNHHNLSYAEMPQDDDTFIIVSEWNAFKSPDISVIKSRLKNPVITDGSNLLPKDITALGFEYYGIGRASGLSLC